MKRSSETAPAHCLNHVFHDGWTRVVKNLACTQLLQQADVARRSGGDAPVARRHRELDGVAANARRSTPRPERPLDARSASVTVAREPTVSVRRARLRRCQGQAGGLPHQRRQCCWGSAPPCGPARSWVLERTLRRLIYGCPDRLSDDSIADLEPLDRATDRRDLTGDVAAENRGIVEPWQKRDVLQNPVEWVDRDGRVADQYLVRRQMRQSGDTDPRGCPGAFARRPD